MAWQVDNVLYGIVLNTGAPGRRFVWSRGPDTDDANWVQSTNMRDWPQGGKTTWTFHGILFSNGNDTADEERNLTQLFANGTIKQFKNYAGETTGIWQVTDMSKLLEVMRDRGFTGRADALETDVRVPRVGDPVD
jgi:hypothetical protein